MFEVFNEYSNEYKQNMNMVFHVSSIDCTIPNVYEENRQIVKCVQNKAVAQGEHSLFVFNVGYILITNYTRL